MCPGLFVFGSPCQLSPPETVQSRVIKLFSNNGIAYECPDLYLIASIKMQCYHCPFYAVSYMPMYSTFMAIFHRLYYMQFRVFVLMRVVSERTILRYI